MNRRFVLLATLSCLIGWCILSACPATVPPPLESCGQQPWPGGTAYIWTPVGTCISDGVVDVPSNGIVIEIHVVEHLCPDRRRSCGD